jgi:serine/threonine protein kinase
MDPSPLATPVDTRGQAAVPAAVADYVVVRQLGEGNHGRYYLARPPARLELAEEFVALKVFGDRVGELAYERGVRELRAFAAVRSPYLVTVYDAVLEDTFAYAMQYFPLGSLSAPARPLARAEVHRALENAARAAHALHEAGMAHGDIKPANVLLTEGSGGSAAGIGGRLSDLGLARFLAPGATLTSMGRASSV